MESKNVRNVALTKFDYINYTKNQDNSKQMSIAATKANKHNK